MTRAGSCCLPQVLERLPIIEECKWKNIKYSSAPFKRHLLNWGVPANPLLAEPLYLTKYIELMCTGPGDMIERCLDAGLAEPEFRLTDGFVTIIKRKPELAFKAVGGEVTPQAAGQVSGQVTEEINRIVFVLQKEMSRTQLQKSLKLKGRSNFEERYLKPALDGGYIEMTLPDKPKSRLQKYRLTEKSKECLKVREKR